MPTNGCTRADAERIAREFVERNDGRCTDRVFEACALDELNWAHPCLYGFEDPDAILAASWIVYVRDTKSLVILRSSDIVLVSKADGSVIYTGSARDEG